MDFTLKTYKQLLFTLLDQDYSFFTFQEYIENNLSLITGNSSIIILRHDVDRLPENALRVAELEKRLGVKGSYYFRVVKESFDAGIIREIAAMGHEIGYHYENLAEVSRQKSGYGIWDMGFGKKMAEGSEQKSGVRSKEEGDSSPESTQNSKLKTQNSIFELAIEDFEENLKKLREICPIKTICMHGSPLSKYDSRDLWEVYDYRDFGIIGEPYFDIDYKKVFYVTDTGRKWNNEAASIRDKVDSGFKVKIRNSSHLISLIKERELPNKIIINTHPQRWANSWCLWVRELLSQNIKNLVKKIIVKKGRRGGENN